MRPIKMLGLAAIVALAATALLEVGSATASTIVCTEGATTSPCPAGTAPYTGLITGSSVGKGIFTYSVMTVECGKSQLMGEITNAGSATENAKGKITELTWAECSSSLCGATTIAASNLPWGFEIEATGENSGVLTISNATYKLVECGNTCEFEAEKAGLAMTGGKEATLAASEVLWTQIGGSTFCLDFRRWTAKYSLEPKHLLLHQL